MSSSLPDIPDYTLLDTTTNSDLLLQKPKLVYLESSNSYLAIASLASHGAIEMFNKGRAAVESQLTLECLPGFRELNEVNVCWWYLTSQEDHLALEEGQAIRLVVSQWLSSQSEPELPEVLYSQIGVAESEWLLYIPDNLRWFKGHFQDMPILPGVVQVDWAVRFGHVFGFDGAKFSKVPRVKFSAVIRPDEVLRLSQLKQKNQLRFVFESAAGQHSKGSIEFA
jgi:hypothetical protein